MNIKGSKKKEHGLRGMAAHVGPALHQLTIAKVRKGNAI